MCRTFLNTCLKIKDNLILQFCLEYQSHVSISMLKSDLTVLMLFSNEFVWCLTCVKAPTLRTPYIVLKKSTTPRRKFRMSFLRGVKSENHMVKLKFFGGGLRPLSLDYLCFLMKKYFLRAPPRPPVPGATDGRGASRP